MSSVIALVALYGAGLTSSLSPCVLPLVPGYLGALGPVPGASKAARVALFCVGAAGSFVLLGALIGSVGWSVSSTGAWLQRVSGLVLVGLGLVLVAGRLGRLGREVRVVSRLPKQPHMMALALGIGCGAAWSPCVGPLLGAALTAAGGAGSASRGALFLLSFAGGVLTPFVVISRLSAPRLPRWTRSLGNVASWASAVLLVTLGVVLAAGWYERLVQRLPIGT